MDFRFENLYILSTFETLVRYMVAPKGPHIWLHVKHIVN